MKQVKFNYGLLSDEMEKQANEQGFTFGEKIEFAESLKKSFNMASIHLLTEKQSESALKKMHSKMIKMLKPIESKFNCKECANYNIGDGVDDLIECEGCKGHFVKSMNESKRYTFKKM